MASKELTAKVRIDVGDAEKSLDNLLDKINKINSTANKLANGYSDVSKNITKGTTSANKLKTATDAVANSANKVSKSFSTSNGILGTMLSKVKRLASIYLGVMGAKAAIGTSDTITSAENKLNYLNAAALGGSGYTTGADGSSQYSTATLNATQQAMDKMYVSAQKVRVAYSDMMSNVSKSMTLAGDAFNYNIDNAIRFQEIMGEAYALSGASEAEKSSSMYQLMQALGSGVLQGDELRSVREGANLAYTAIEQFAQGVYNTTDSLKEMGSQGLITSDIVVAAIMNAGESMDNAFQQTKMTFGQAWTEIKNTAIRAFQPILKQMNDLLNSDVGQSIMTNITKAIVLVANFVSLLIQGFTVAYTYLQSFFSWFADNWYWIQYIAIFALVMISGYLIYMGVQALIAGVKAAIGFITAHAALFSWLLLIALVIVYIVWLANSVQDGCQFIANVAWALAVVIIGIIGLVAVVYAITGQMLIGKTGLIILAIIAIIFLIVVAVMNYGEQIIGAVYVVVAVINNVIAAVVNFCLGVFNAILTAFDNMCLGIMNFGIALGNAIQAICSNIGIAFQNAWIWAKNTFWEFIGDVLEGLSKLEPVINGIASLIGKQGIDLSGLASSAKSKKEDYIDYVSVSDAWTSGLNTYDYKSIQDAFNEGFNTFDYKNLSEEYAKGAEKGAAMQDAINNWFDGIKSKISDATSGFSLEDLIDEINGLGGIDLPINTDLPLNTDDFNNLGNLPNIDDTLGSSGKGIKGDTGKIADAVDISNEELEYLRKIAEMEWKKEYTTAQITIDMTNNNNINGESDLDGIVTKLSEKLYEEMAIVANGTYA